MVFSFGSFLFCPFGGDMACAFLPIIGPTLPKKTQADSRSLIAAYTHLTVSLISSGSQSGCVATKPSTMPFISLVRAAVYFFACS